MLNTDPQMLLLLWFILPVWLIAGFCDWLCHRATGIERTTGVKETWIHILMFLEMGLPLLAALFLEVNALIIAVMIAMFFLHEMTALWDVSYAVSARKVTPIEQHIHSFLEMLPLMALLLIISRHWSEFLALFGLNDDAASFDIRLRADPLPVTYIVVIFSGIILFEFLPYLEEYFRVKRYRKKRTY
ncbi:diguanylate cyclase [Pseudescherichia vulneris]|uniref:diguanylate cyclase n=1 Tax=Pseudescherichia vulneris TaxID=566 RepID=UPI00227D2DAC|nr:diguanylate cyclase [Pseudescherichia vulneris]WAH52097.1 diguanylate cyclase [Pseudescherichia vulneris]